MKNHSLYRTAIFVFLLILHAACGDDEPGINVKPIITDRGSAQGSAVNVIIGSDGGTLESADGRLAITIPAGALTSNTTISIQPISNEGPLGLGSGYRLLPEGTIFRQPVTLTFSYNDDLLDNASEDFLWVITQSDDGSWNALLNSEVNTSAKTVTITTTHFSDWALGRFIDLKLEPASKTVLKGQSVGLKLVGFSVDDTVDDLAPLAPLESDAEQKELLTRTQFNEEQMAMFHITGWSLNGTFAPVSNSNGSLNASNSNATYRAPDARPSVNPVAVSVHLEARSNSQTETTQYIVGASITVVESDLYVMVKVDGEIHDYYQYGFNGGIPPDPNNVSIANCGTDGEGGLVIGGTFIQDGTVLVSGFVLEIADPAEGTIGLECINDDGEDDASFQLAAGQKYYSIGYTKRTPVNQNCDYDYLCGSFSVTFTDYEDRTMGNVRGYFSGTLYEPADENSCQSDIPHAVEGEFWLKRAD